MRPGSSQHGFTLIELVLAIVIIGVLGVAGVRMFSDTAFTTRSVNAGQKSADESRYAVERVARELREVKYANSEYKFSPTTITSPASSISFYRTVGGVDVLTTVALSGTNVTLSDGTTTSVLARNVTAFSMALLQLDNTTATAGSNVRFVRITLTTSDPTSGQSNSMQTRIVLRNTA